MTLATWAAKTDAGVMILVHAIEGCFTVSQSLVEARDGFALQPGSL